MSIATLMALLLAVSFIAGIILLALPTRFYSTRWWLEPSTIFAAIVLLTVVSGLSMPH